MVRASESFRRHPRKLGAGAASVERACGWLSFGRNIPHRRGSKCRDRDDSAPSGRLGGCNMFESNEVSDPHESFQLHWHGSCLVVLPAASASALQWDLIDPAAGIILGPLKA